MPCHRAVYGADGANEKLSSIETQEFEDFFGIWAWIRTLGAVVVSVLVAYRSRPIPPDPGATGDAVGGVPTAVTASLHAQT